MKLDNETYRKLVKMIGAADHQGCCGCMRAGFQGGAQATLELLGLELDSDQLYHDVSEESNRLWDEEHPDA